MYIYIHMYIYIIYINIQTINTSYWSDKPTWYPHLSAAGAKAPRCQRDCAAAPRCGLKGTGIRRTL